jgi:cyclopropane fatty-acyl-phospholipid synthase-like methyltransferase
VNRPCLVCGGCYGASPLPGLRACESCGFTSANLEISPDELRALYAERYFVGGEYKDYAAERQLHEKHFLHRLKLLLRHVSQPETKTLFEVGCAHGFFLNLARERFREVRGIDISVDAARYARDVLDLNVTAGDLLQEDSIGTPDVVCLWDTIEHLDRPDAYLQKLCAVMPKGSVIALTTGDIGSVVARIRGSRWRQIHPPTHLHYFSAATLVELLRNCGFETFHIDHEGTYRSLDTAAYIILNLKHHKPGLYRMLKKTGLLRFTFYLNLYDIVLMLARKS